MSKNPVERLGGLCVVTGASSGIGLELTKLAAKDGCDLVLVADTNLAQAESAARELGAGDVRTLEANLATRDGIMQLMQTIGDREVDVLMANAAAGHGGAFLDQEWGSLAHIIHTNITGTVALIHLIGKKMRARNAGRILVTGSIVGDMPGAFNLTYNSTKAFLNDFSVGLANELKNSEIVVTCLVPGATDTPFFEKADMEDTTIGRQPKADPAKVAKDGYEALLKGEVKEVSGLLNKVQSLFADILPDAVLAQMHRRMVEPDRHKESGSA